MRKVNKVHSIVTYVSTVVNKRRTKEINRKS